MKEQSKSWSLSKHADTIVVLGALFSGFLWVNGKFNDVNTRLVKIETVLILQKIMPAEIAKAPEIKKEKT